MTVPARVTALLVACVASLALALAATPAPALAANGCGPAGFGWVVPDRPLGFDFHGACERHDGCYSTPWRFVARSRPAAKLTCDTRFFADMDAACVAGTRELRRLRLCRSLSLDYFRAVRTWFGELAYGRAQR